MKQSIELPRDILASLGRVAWTAMNLEDWAGSVCHEILGAKERNYRFIGPRIEMAVNVLKAHDDASLQPAIGWLNVVKAELKTRNEILHGVPVSVVGGVGGSATTFLRWDEVRDRPLNSTTYLLTVSALDAVSERFEIVLDGWRDTISLVHGVWQRPFPDA